jgi:hypothetical protein
MKRKRVEVPRSSTTRDRDLHPVIYLSIGFNSASVPSDGPARSRSAVGIIYASVPCNAPRPPCMKKASICIRGWELPRVESRMGNPCHVVYSRIILHQYNIIPHLNVKFTASYRLSSERDFESSCRQYFAFDRDVAFSLTSSGAVVCIRASLFPPTITSCSRRSPSSHPSITQSHIPIHHSTSNP